MDIIKVIESLRRKGVKKIGYIVLILVFIVDFFIPRHEIHFIGDIIPGFWSLFGFI